jgi:dihydrofolate reductase
VVSEFISLDGVVEDPGGAEQFEHGGWAFKFERGPEGDKFKLDEVMASEALLLGRVTYEGFAGAWPSRTGEFAEKFNGMPKYVVSSTLRDPSWTNSNVIDGHLAEAVTSLKRKHAGDILVNGSVQLARALLEQELLDELRLMVYPTVLGSGKRLFVETGAPISLRVTESRRAGDTVIMVLERSNLGEAKRARASARGSRDAADRAPPPAAPHDPRPPGAPHGPRSMSRNAWPATYRGTENAPGPARAS